MAREVLERKTLQKGEHVFREGAQGIAAYIVQDGEVQIYTDIDGQKTVLGTIGQGAIFGEMALIDDKPRMAGARMSKGGTVIIVTKKLFQQKLNKADPFIRGLLKILVENLRQLQLSNAR